MLLLIEPDQPVRKNPMSIGRALVRRDVEHKRLDSLTWTLADEYALEDVLPAALRRGIVTGRGLIVDEGFVKTLLAADFLERSQQAQDSLSEELTVIAHDANAPGYQERRERVAELQKAARSANQEKLDEAQKARTKLLSEPIKDELQAHWTAATQRVVVDYDDETGQPIQYIEPERDFSDQPAPVQRPEVSA